MVASYYTKKLQGSLFRTMRDIVMGITPFPDEERVGSNKDENTVSFSINGNVEKSATRNSENSVTYADVMRTQRGGISAENDSHA